MAATGAGAGSNQGAGGAEGAQAEVQVVEEPLLAGGPPHHAHAGRRRREKPLPGEGRGAARRARRVVEAAAARRAARRGAALAEQGDGVGDEDRVAEELHVRLGDGDAAAAELPAERGEVGGGAEEDGPAGGAGEEGLGEAQRLVQAGHVAARGAQRREGVVGHDNGRRARPAARSAARAQGWDDGSAVPAESRHKVDFVVCVTVGEDVASKIAGLRTIASYNGNPKSGI